MSYMWSDKRDANGNEVLRGFSCDRDGCTATILSETWRLPHEYGWTRRQKLIRPLSFPINEHYCAAHSAERAKGGG